METIFISIPIEEFLDKIDERIEKRLSRIKQPSPINDNISFREACMVTGQSESKMYKLTASGEVPCARFNNKLTFSRKKLEAWMTANTIVNVSGKDHAIKDLQKQAIKKLNK
jgi:excisionase family DNA binding protein